MPTTSPIGVEADAAAWSSGIGAGAGSHLPIGYYGSAHYRAIMRFIPPAWSSWTAITKATLTVYISDFQHVGPRNSSIYCRRQNVTSGSFWTKSAGSQSCESGFTGSNTTQYDDMAASSTGQVQFSSGTTANRAVTLDVTDIVAYYWASSATRMPFVFEPVDTDDYTELWSDERSGYDATLTITYVVQSPPNAPTLTAPASGAVSGTQTPTFSWTHSDPQGDAQVNAQVRVWDAAGTTQIGATSTVTGAGTSLVWPASLPRGVGYQFDVRTADAANGYGAWSAKRAFSVKALPVVTITPTRYMAFAGSPGAPRLVVKWSSNQPQGRYRVQVASPAFDSGWLSGAATSYTLATQPVVDNVAQSITVSVENTDSPALVGTATRSFTPRYGLTVHRRDLGAAPAAWGSPLIDSVVPADATLKIEYGSSATATATPSPNTWYSTLSAAPKARYVFYRAWFIPSATAGPTLNSISLVSSNAVAQVDKWSTSRLNTPVLVAPWSIDPYEYVYGSRSMTCDVNGTHFAYSYSIKLLQGRSYILTGLMKTDGNPSPSIRLVDPNGALLQNALGQNIATPNAAADTDWFTTDQRDVNRYKTPVYVAPNDVTVFVQLRCTGAAGSKAWWDAIKLEESTVATPWSPGAVGATIVDAGGVQVDGSSGGVLRYRGTAGGDRDLVQGGSRGLMFGPDTQVYDGGGGEVYLSNANGNNILRLVGVSGEAAGVYSALLVSRGGDVAARVVMGYSGDVARTGLFVGSGAAARDTNLYRSGVAEWTTDGALVIGGRLRLTGIISPASLVANTDNWNPTGLATASIIRISTDTTVRVLSGIVAGANGDLLILSNVNGATAITLAHELTSTGVNRFLCPNNVNYTLNSRQTVMAYYDGISQRWRIID